ncbi:uncharacterized protein LOC143853895 [Tasmannia lanceolata]|uniref:uncharacterized protein LOC143853895 n=1 Tax=Tasmannia lanceolata TaxID=3420 RepID=UPI0040641456
MCAEDGESANHLLIHYKVAREVWGNLLTRFSIFWVFPKSLMELLQYWFEVLWRKKGKNLWEISHLATRLVLWKEHNSRLFKGFARGSRFLFNKVMALTIAWAKILTKFALVSTYDLWEGWSDICMSSERKQKMVQKWDLPLNFDGSSFGNPGLAGIRWVLRDEHDNVIWAYAGPIGIADASEAEVRAARQGIKTIAEKGVYKVIIEGDSLNVIRWLQGSKKNPWRLDNFFDEIADCFISISMPFKNVLRSANEMTDKLARLGDDRILSPL